MSTVQLAIKKVKGLSDSQAQALLDWLSKQESRPRTAKPAVTPRRKLKRKQSMTDLMAWYDSIRGTTDWEPPRMPDDLVPRVKL